MPNNLNKKRIVFIPDKLFDIIKEEAKERDCSNSKVLREKCWEGIKNGKKEINSN